MLAFPTLSGPPYEGTEILLNQYGNATIEGEIAVADQTQEYWFFSRGSAAIIETSGTTDTVVAYYEQAGDPTQTDDFGIDGLNGRLEVSTPYDTPVAISVGGSGEATGAYSLSIDMPDVFVNEIDVNQVLNYGVEPYGYIFDSNEWYKFTPGDSGSWTISIDTDGAFDATLAVFDQDGDRLLIYPDGDANLPQNEVGANDVEQFVLSVPSSQRNNEFFVRVGNVVDDGYYEYEVTIQGPQNFDFFSDSNACDNSTSGICTDITHTFGLNAFGNFDRLNQQTNLMTRFYRLPDDVPGSLYVATDSDTTAIGLYYDSGYPDVTAYDEYGFGPSLEALLPGDGRPVVIGVRGTGSYSLTGYLGPPSGERISIGDDLTGTGIAQPGSADQWLNFRAPVAGQYVVSSSRRDVSVYGADGQRIAGPSDSVTVELERRETAYIRVEAYPFGSSVITVDALGAAVVIDTLTAPFVILDPLISQFTMSVNWESLSGIADALQVFLERVDEFDGVTEEDSIIAQFDLTSGTGPGEIEPIPADTFVYPEDVPGETVYRIRLRAFDGDGTPSIAGLEIGAIGMTETATLIRGDYNRDGAVDAADYTVWRDALGGAYDRQIDGDGDGLIGVGDYSVWREGYGSVSTAAVWDFEGLEDGSFPTGWDTSGDLSFGEWGAAPAVLGVSGTVMRMFHDATEAGLSSIAPSFSPAAFAAFNSRSTTVVTKRPRESSEPPRPLENASLHLLLAEAESATDQREQGDTPAVDTIDAVDLDRALERLSLEELREPLLSAVSPAVT